MKIRGNKTHKSWYDAKRRCENPKSNQYEWYGARGISMCARWSESYEAFLLDMGEKPEGLTLERVDNEGDYTPDNCTWITQAEQMRNRRSCRMTTIDGETKTIKEWAESYGVKYNMVRKRIVVLGWDPMRALTAPAKITVSHNQNVTWNGNNQTILEWSRELGIEYGTLRSRLFRYKWPVEKAMTEPVKPGGPNKGL